VTHSTQVFTTATDWYVFNESAATLRGTGLVDGVDATDKVWVVNSAVLFPTAADGIRGEICVTRHPFGDVVRGTVAPPAPGSPQGVARQADHSLLSDDFVAAWGAGDRAAVRKLLSEHASAAVRLDAEDGTPTVHRAVGADDVVDVLAALLPEGGPHEIGALTRIATEWYVFAEFLVRRPGGGVRRLAITQPLEDGAIIGVYGYGRDEA
jgi:hypothetical protein